MPIHHLHEPIDVFSEWLDDCEAAERGEVAPASNNSSSSNNNKALSRSMRNVVHDTSQDHYEDDDSVESDGLPEASGLSGLSNKKRPAASSSGGGEDGGGKKPKATTATLGLDESDDDSD